MTATITIPPTADTPIGGRRLGDLTSLREHWTLGHGQEGGIDQLVGYIVRRTVDKRGRVEWHDETRTELGVDLAVFDGVGAYPEALAHARLHRVGKQWAAVDMVYECGCRS